MEGMQKRAFITGVTGQDGSYLAELLLDKGYQVFGLVRETSSNPSELLKLLCDQKGLRLLNGDLHDRESLMQVVATAQPDEVYNLASQSHVGVSFDAPDDTWEVNYVGAGRVITAALAANGSVRIYQASSSEMFGAAPPPQSEVSEFLPVSPYGEAKLRAHKEFVVENREKHGAYVCSGFLFNHESPRRGKHFVTRKITVSLAKIKLGLQDRLELGNLDTRRDWGYAKEYVVAMHAMLQMDKPEDFVIATGVQHSVRDFVDAAAAELGMSMQWEGKGEAEVGRNSRGEVIVSVNPRFFRPQELSDLVGDASKAKDVLGWKPMVTFRELVSIMTSADYDSLVRQKLGDAHISV